MNKVFNENKNGGWLNSKVVIGFALGLVIGLGIMYLNFPERIAKTQNGEEIIATLDDEEISVDSLYSIMKKDGGLNELLSKVDEDIALKEYPNSEEAAAADAKEQAESYYTMYQQYYGYTKEEFLAANGFTEEAFIDYLTRDYYNQKIYDDYIATLITDKDISKEYKNVFGDKKIHLFYASAKDNKLEDVRKALKKGTSFDKIKEKFGEDVTATEVTVSYEDILSYSEKFITQLKSLKKGGYTKIFKDDNFGYVVISLVETGEKKKEEEMTDTVKMVLQSKLEAKDVNLYYKALINVRNKYNFSIKDTELNKEYNEYLKQYK